MSDKERQPLPADAGVASADHVPYLDALVEYAARDAGRYHVPGHKGGLGGASVLARHLGRALELDIPACTRGIDVGEEPTPLALAEELAAEAWGAARTWFLVNGATEGSHLACLALGQAGPGVVVQRNAHSSTMHGLVLSGARPTFIAPEIDDQLAIAHCVTPEALSEALDSSANAAGAIVVSPTYFGAAADVRALAGICHERGAALVVDEAWGAHFRFHGDLPDDAISAGADLVISGTHKLVGSLTQSAMLHLGPGAGEYLDESNLERALGLVRTTSPSSLLLASLDAARLHASRYGEELLEEALAGMDLLCAAIEALPGLRTLGRDLAGRPGVHDIDPYRLAIDVSASGFQGNELADELHRLADINLELATQALLIVHFGLGEPVYGQGVRLVEALAQILHAAPAPEGGSAAAAQQERSPGRWPGRAPLLPIPHPPWGPLVLSPREAFFAPHDRVSLADAEGRISAESLVLYPPGIANVLPGERLTGENIDFLTTMAGRGRAVRGTAGGSLDALRVVSRSS